MKLKRIVLPITIIIFIFLLISCNSALQYDFSIDDMVVYLNDEPAKLQINYFKKQSEISYSYDKSKLRIFDNHVECFYEGEYVVEATSKGNKKEFKVTGLVGLDIDNIYVWVGYPDVELIPTLNVDEQIRYETNTDIIKITDNKIKALKPGKTVVKAIAGRFQKTFWVTSLVPQSENDFYYWGADWKSKAINYKRAYELKGTDNKTTIFIGDSFFDPICFTMFDEHYKGKDALCFGISASTTQTWEMLFKDLNGDQNNKDNSYFADVKPKNIVIQLGNNNIYNDRRSADDAAKDIQALLTLLHGMLPDTKIYLFAVTPRNGEYLRHNTIKLNKTMHKYAIGREWLVYLDTNDIMTPDKLSDGIHPDPDQYYIFVDALEEAGIEIEDK
ncbi:MAG: GDSL-type esterase/lipase family protein [Acholeplasmatales bacterium]